MQIHFKLLDATALSGGHPTCELRTTTCHLATLPLRASGLAWWWWRCCTCTLTYCVSLLTCCLALCQDVAVVRKCRHLYYYNYYVDVHSFSSLSVDVWMFGCLPACLPGWLACLRSGVSFCTLELCAADFGLCGVYAINSIGQYYAKLRAISRSQPSLALCRVWECRLSASKYVHIYIPLQAWLTPFPPILFF